MGLITALAPAPKKGFMARAASPSGTAALKPMKPPSGRTSTVSGDGMRGMGVASGVAAGGALMSAGSDSSLANAYLPAKRV
jgi:hypothetical protein